MMLKALAYDFGGEGGGWMEKNQASVVHRKLTLGCQCQRGAGVSRRCGGGEEADRRGEGRRRGGKEEEG